jgi:hypothetical protein
VLIATNFTQLALKYRIYGKAPGFSLNHGILEDQNTIWRYGRGAGIKQTVKNGMRIIKDAGFKAFFPVQKGISEWMGDVRILRKNQSLISEQQINHIQPRLEPGDVLLERREWYLSNVGLPGYWPHAALYIGTPERRKHYFNTPEIISWLNQQGISDGNFESLLQQRYPEAYAESLKTQEKNHQVRVIEAISEGVVFTSIEHSASSDSLAVLRPRLKRIDKAKAILQAFHYHGRPYDFNFDFLTDNELVCTELVYKAYESNRDKHGLTLPIVNILGRKATPANLFVKQFDKHFDTERQQFDLVLFFDGQEKSKTAIKSDIKSFRKSWKRPKWHILTQTAHD